MAFFYRRNPKKFNYKPRYYDPDQEEWERKKAERGIDTNLSHEEQLRLKMRRSWGAVKQQETKEEQRAKLIHRIAWGVLVVFLFYVVFCTPLLQNIISGLTGK